MSVHKPRQNDETAAQTESWLQYSFTRQPKNFISQIWALAIQSFVHSDPASAEKTCESHHFFNRELGDFLPPLPQKSSHCLCHQSDCTRLLSLPSSTRDSPLPPRVKSPLRINPIHQLLLRQRRQWRGAPRRSKPRLCSFLTSCPRTPTAPPLQEWEIAMFKV